MAKFMWSLVLVAAAVCAVSGGPAKGGRIVGGSAITIQQWPSIAQIESRTVLLWSQICACNIITNFHCLTVAHCVDGPLLTTVNRRIRAGTTQRGSGGVTNSIDRIVHHPSYGTQGYNGDLAIVKLDRYWSFGPTIQPIAIVSQGFNLTDNLPVKSAGWGSVADGGSASNVLHEVEKVSINIDNCTASYMNLAKPEVITYNMLCTGVTDVVGKGACEGDFGGPVTYSDVLVGCMAFSESCGHPLYPTVSTRIASYTNWIQANAN